MEVVKVSMEHTDEGRHLGRTKRRPETLACHSRGSLDLTKEVHKYLYDHMCSSGGPISDLAVERRKLHYSDR
jgi:hypothetical protein